jgi:hypothetical protein
MKSFNPTSLVLVLALATSTAALDLSSAERAALAAQPATDIATLRAGASEPVASVAMDERLALDRAETRSGDLDELRAVDDHDLSVIAIVIAVVILAIIIF